MADMKLKPHPTIPPPDGPVLVAILDGWGANVEDEWNAVASAATPVTDALKARGASLGRTVYAHGTWVGLPSDADMGNSEVGHNALGSGQVIDQGARLVDLALSEGHMFSGAGWKLISEAFAEHTVHFIGLLSDGGVHSRYDQLVACVRGAAERGAKRIRVHALADGRDVPDGSSLDFFAQLRDDLAAISKEHPGVDARIASGGGRMVVSMDRYEADWEMVARGWRAHVLGVAPHYFEDPVDAVRTLRGEEGAPGGLTTDQYLPPFVIVEKTKSADGEEKQAPVGTVEDGDAVVLFNFRADRMVELSKAFEYEQFEHFDRERHPKDLKFVGMMQYDGDLLLPKHFLVPPPEIRGTSGEHLARSGVATFACSETQKFGHVTFFWNGNRSGYFDEALETYVEIPSDNLPFNQAPRMKAAEITEAGIAALKSGKYRMVRINYANPDMVGHTGDLEAAKEACAFTDACLGRLLAACDEAGGRFLVTADHGNADDMAQRDKKTRKPLIDEKNGRVLALTSHTLAPVPVYVGGKGLPENVAMREDLPEAGLANVTATYINLLGLEAPENYKPSLIGTK